jgi:hypothetical protein
MECVFVFYVIKKLIKNLIHDILINVLFDLKVKYHMVQMLNQISKVYFVITMIEQIIFIVKDLKLFVLNILEI